MNTSLLAFLGLAMGSIPLCPLASQQGQPSPLHLEARLRNLEKSSPGSARVIQIGKTRSGKPILALRIQKGANRHPKPGFLLVAGLDGRRTQDTEVALEVAKDLLHSKPDTLKGKMLESWTIWVIPLANPDGSEKRREGNLGPVDEDRDGRIDEDGPEDLDGDHKVLWMRKKDPEGTYIQDPKTGLMRKAVPEKGEAGVYKVWREGLDNDKDGDFNEDPEGGIIPNRNFPHMYPEHGKGAGPYVLSEPEALSLAQFVIRHPRIRTVLTLGAFDNLGGKAKRNSSQKKLPINGYYPRDARTLADFAKAIGRKGTKGEDDWPGRFHAWVYAHAGRTSLALCLGGGKDSSRRVFSKSPTSKPAEKKGKGKTETVKQTDQPKDMKKRKIRISPWKPFNHPQLGTVEIGGGDPLGDSKYSKETQKKGVPLVTKLLVNGFERRCKLRVAKLETKAMGTEAIELRVVVRNEGKEASRTEVADRLGFPRLPRLEFVRYFKQDPASSRRWEKKDVVASLLAGKPFVFIPSKLLLGQTVEFRWILKKPAPETLGLRIIQEGVVFDIKEVK